MKSLTVVMPALNEELNLEQAVKNAQKSIEPFFQDWEILIFNDGSSDKTGEIADALAASDPRVHAYHHDSPKNLGGVYREGVKKASKEYLIMLPGDNENAGEAALKPIFDAVGKADVIVPYVKNPQVRPLRRRLISRAFVCLTNLTSGCHLKYYNGTVLHKTELLRKHEFSNTGFGYQAEILVNFVRAGYSYLEVGVSLSPRAATSSKAFSFSNFVKVAKLMKGLSSKRWQAGVSASSSLKAGQKA